jgi:hypothetical protein
MMKHEFEARIKATVSAEDYVVIEKVYAFHPIIDEVDGKDQIAQLYKLGGMALINDMVPRAEEAQQLENEIFHYRREIEDAQRNLGIRLAKLAAMKVQ